MPGDYGFDPLRLGANEDVGLIFLSAIATSVVTLGKKQNISEESIMGTSLVAITLSTLFVGSLIIGIGKLKLASLIQYIPLPVVGGYLGYVGFFVMQAGVSIASNAGINGLVDWPKLFPPGVPFPHHPVLKLLPAVGAMLIYMFALKRFKNPVVLPIILVSLPVLFYAALFLSKTSLHDAQVAGWAALPPTTGGGGPFYEVYSQYHLDKVTWSILPRQIPTVLALFLVVAFGSSMDVAAIQSDYPKELDFDRELVTVGISNVVTGLLGVGFTGSYIFSQTIFSMRAGVSTAGNAVVVFVLEFTLFLVPVYVVQYFPNFFFGSLMVWFGVEIMLDWLVRAFWRVTRVEFVLIWLTFIAIMALTVVSPVEGLEMGIGVGIVMAALHFAVEYAQVQVAAFGVVPSRSGAVRTMKQRNVLDLFLGNMLAVSLNGYVFFGSSVKISQRVKEVGKVVRDAKWRADGNLDQSATGQMLRRRQSGQEFVYNLYGKLPELTEQCIKAVEAAPKFLLLDFRRVTGLDATAARTLASLVNSLNQMGVTLLITHLPVRRPWIKRLLRAQKVIEGENDDEGLCIAFDTMEDGLMYCEDQMMQVAVRYGLIQAEDKEMDLLNIIKNQMHPDDLDGIDLQSIASQLNQVVGQIQLQSGDNLFSVGDISDHIYLLRKGRIVCEVNYLEMTTWSRFIGSVLPHQNQERTIHKTIRYGPGGVLGDLDFVIQRPRSFNAKCEIACKLYSISKEQQIAMRRSQPELLNILQSIILRSASLSASHALEAFERSNLV
eukprot:TRINITY_DN4023_c0_g1_i5.p1 TRINITY_DN4023_c0_g1~~TRINITY_DN4023_c0_g1_i5.p1  ORF type:complete len:784 (+),score=96.96 TRINITY_DN4023_c0_g1_i5:30-2354(+)